MWQHLSFLILCARTRSLRFIKKKNLKNEIKLLYSQLKTLSPNSHSELAANLALANRNPQSRPPAHLPRRRRTISRNYQRTRTLPFCTLLFARTRSHRNRFNLHISRQKTSRSPANFLDDRRHTISPDNQLSPRRCRSRIQTSNGSGFPTNRRRKSSTSSYICRPSSRSRYSAVCQYRSGSIKLQLRFGRVSKNC